MSPKDEKAVNWLRRATEDLGSARRLLAGEDPITNTACFHCQQAVEKVLKAYLQAQGIAVPRTHLLENLVQSSVDLESSFASVADAAGSLTPYAVEVRYESARLIPVDEARAALRHAESAFDFVARRLPEMLRAELAALKVEGQKESK